MNIRVLVLSGSFALTCWAGSAPCALNAPWFDPFNYKGFTYEGVTVTVIKENPPKKGEVSNPWFKDGTVTVKIEGGSLSGSTTNISHLKWGIILSSCSSQNVPNSIRMKFGIPLRTARVAMSAAAMAPVDYEVADLNGDGNGDGIFIPATGTGIAVQLGTSQGTFQTEVDYPTGPMPQALTVADFNGDGNRDVAVANAGSGQGAGSLSILLGRGDGTFHPILNYDQGNSIVALFVADLNRDSRLDIAVANDNGSSSGTVDVMFGTGLGSFQAPVSYPVQVNPTSVVAADVNGDLNLDLAVANRGSGTVSVLLGDTFGRFSAAHNITVGGLPDYLGAAYLDQDDLADLVVLHAQSATLSVWRGQQDGSLLPVGRYLAGVGAASFVILEDDSGTAVLAPDSVRPRFLYYPVEPATGELLSTTSYLMTQDAMEVAVADFDGDQNLDAAVPDNRGGVSVMLGTGTGDFTPGAGFTSSQQFSAADTAILAANFDSNAAPDVAVANGGANNISVYFGSGDGGLTEGPALSGLPSPTALAAGDLNGDTLTDLVAVQKQPVDTVNLAVYLNNGDGTFQSAALYPHADAVNSAAVALGDLNGDERPDVVVANSDLSGTNGGISVLLTNADGTLGGVSRLMAGADVTGVTVADFDLDAHADILWAGEEVAGQFHFVAGWARGNGDGTFQDSVLIDVDDFPKTVLSTDLNQDGNPDAVIAHCCGVTDLTWLLGNGDGIFQVDHAIGGQDPTGIAIGKFDSDVYPDLAILDNAGGNTAAVLSALLTPPPVLRNFSAATNSLHAVPPDSIVAAYGQGLATGTAVAATADWPDTLGGTRVNILDSQGASFAGRIYYASPSQVNYATPPGIASGYALVTISADGLPDQQGFIWVNAADPGIFTAGDRIAAALVLRIPAGGELSYEPVVGTGSDNSLIALPINLGAADDDVLLALFGTGIRGRSSVGKVVVTIDGVPAEVTYADKQGEYPGLDQVNVRIPKSLRGRGLVNVVMTVDGAVSNVATIRIL